MDLVEIIYFSKKCPHCKSDMRQVNRMYISWYECRNEKDCPGMEKDPDSDDKYPFKSNVVRR